jgi:hypothetical protein
MVKIIGISGRKQAGKNTVANYIHGGVLLHNKMIEDFFVNEEGQLAVKTADTNSNYGYGIFDVTRKDDQFIQYAERELWPYIKIYHFADPLKEMCINLFNLNPKHVYGNNDDKNSLTNLSWKDIPASNKTEGSPTVREFLEHFGTKIIRNIYHNAWSEYTIKKIVKEQSSIAVIPDVRFPNEIDAIKSHGGIVIRLTRNIYDSPSESESALDQSKYDWSNFDHIIDNSQSSLDDLSNSLVKIQHLWGIQ